MFLHHKTTRSLSISIFIITTTLFLFSVHHVAAIIQHAQSSSSSYEFSTTSDHNTITIMNHAMMMKTLSSSIPSYNFTYGGRLSTSELLQQIMMTNNTSRESALSTIASQFYAFRLPIRFSNNLNVISERIEVIAFDPYNGTIYLIVNGYNVESYFYGKNASTSSDSSNNKIVPLFSEIMSPYFPTAFDGKSFVLIFEPNGFANILKQSDNATTCRTVLHMPSFKMFNPVNVRNQFVISNVYGMGGIQVMNKESGECLTFNNEGYLNNLMATFSVCNKTNPNQLFVWTGAYLVPKYPINDNMYQALKRDFAFGTSFLPFSPGFKYIRMTMQFVTPANYDLVRADKTLNFTDSSIEQFYKENTILIDDNLKGNITALISQALNSNMISQLAFKWSRASSMYSPGSSALVVAVTLVLLVTMLVQTSYF
ncbi:hypothetical protein C9374_008243 [Naegleria lovaniensis]|uniref:Uncharacterized protein n=1 Tax=Naegleria lovaniensis TaxID=51637 RepID=A0AA88GJE7_NAELO|nr:uncharacterized protein C9374_008243 [Naegleria lovaniensis]KAG2378604.1 hypothetical protein C9374_008243 [Naegleria lovaniensis]